jgi:hypothetical protein
MEIPNSKNQEPKREQIGFLEFGFWKFWGLESSAEVARISAVRGVTK